MELIRLELMQFAPALGDPASNMRRIGERARVSDADLFLTPELSVTGYDLGDEAAHLAVPVRTGIGLARSDAISDAAAHIVLGLAELGPDRLPYNALVVVHRGVVRFRHRKLYLPTYGPFDEGRFWGRGRHLETWAIRGWRVGLLICEDLWHPGLTYALAAAGIQLLLVACAAPGRGVLEPGSAAGRFASWATWERIVRVTAELYGIYVALANRTGVEGGLTFAGGSLIVAPDGSVVARADDDGEASLTASLDPEALATARRPFAHARDEDVGVVVRALQRLESAV